jgi:hypothetical protein
MIRRPSARLALPLVVSALLAGCGGSSSATTSSSQTSSTPAATSTAATSTATTGASTTPGGSAAALGTPRAVAECKRAIKAAPTLPAKAKVKLEAACERAAHGDLAAVKQAAREVCQEVINSSPVPNGPEKAKALSACQGKAKP